MSHEAAVEREPEHAGKGHLVENIVVFVLMFGMFVLGVYLLTWFTPQNIWPMGALVVLSFIAFFIPQGIIGRADTGYDLAEGKQSDAKETSAGVSS